MSDTTPAPTEPAHRQERNLGQEIARNSAINFTASAAGVIGLFGGLVVVSRFIEWRKPNGDVPVTDNTLDPEPTES